MQIHRLHLFLITLAACALGFASVAAFAQSPVSRPPNVLIITIDTLRPDHVGVYGYAKARTHTIDQIASMGVRFENALTSFPRTTPALASMVTGLTTWNHGSRDVGIPLKHGTTLAEVLKKQGYDTHAVTSTPLASVKQHLDRGFDHFDGPTIESDQYLATAVTQKALHMVRGTSPRRPQFLWAHYFDPHFPYEPPIGFENQPEAAGCRKLIQSVIDNSDTEWNLHSNWGSAPERTRDECIELYDATIHYTDTEISRLLVGLNEIGFLSSSIIVITADHGESFGESGTYFEHGVTVNDSVMRIPMIIVAPGVEARVEQALFSLEDLMPTLLGLLGLPREVRPKMDGRDFSSSLRTRAGLQPPEGVLFAEAANADKPPLFALPFDADAIRKLCAPGKVLPGCRKFGGAGELLAAIMRINSEFPDLPGNPSVKHAQAAIDERFSKGEARQISVRNRDFKLVQAPRIHGGTQRALFDLKRDPAETIDVSTEHPELLKRLSAQLDQWEKGIPKYDLQQLDPEDVEALRRLGYIE